MSPKSLYSLVVAQVLVFLGEFYKTVLVGNHVWVGDQRRYLLKARLQTI